MVIPISPRGSSSNFNAPTSDRLQRRNRLRRILLESLERRELLAADAHAVFAPGTSWDYVDSVEADFAAQAGTSGVSGNFNVGDARWTNPVGGASPNAGDPAIVTWSIVPDGTATDDGTASNLVNFMDSIYGGSEVSTIADKPWFNIFERAYDNWSEVSGLTFVYEASDDGADIDGANRGIDSVRGDVRIGGRNVDGNNGILAFNYYPTGGGNSGWDGDMIIDTNDSFYVLNSEAATGENRGLSNVLMHEAGHGIGLGHSIPVDNTKLMEPFISFAFLGPQHDDILGAQDLYGDTYENDDDRASARDLGELGNGITGVSQVSINEPGDDDWISFSIPSSGRLNLTLDPVGEQYEIGNQGGSTAPVDTLRNMDLSVELQASDGTVLASGNANGTGESETITDYDFSAGGTYYLRVSGSGVVDPQLYDLSLRLTGLTGDNIVVQPPRLLSVSSNAGEILSFNNTNELNESPSELTFRFDGAQLLDASSLQGIRITRAGFDGSFTDGNEVEIEPGYVGFGESDRIIVVRFASPLPDDLYQVEVFGEDDPDAGISAIRNINGDVLRPRIEGTDRDTLTFDLEIGTEIVAVVPQPTSRDATTGVVSQARDQIEVYFGEGDLMHPVDVTSGGAGGPTVVNPNFYRLYADHGTVSNTDDELHIPTSISYFADRNMALLTFAGDIATLTAGNSNFRLRVGTNETLPNAPVSLTQPVDPGSTFTSANSGPTDLGVFGSLTSLELSEQIVNDAVFPLDFPGAPDMPSDREIYDDPNPNEIHLLSDAADSDVGITRIYYTLNTVDSFGLNNQGIPLFSAITTQQSNRVREVFEFYGSLLGIDFIETQETALAGERVLWVVTGELDGPGGALAAAGGNLAIMDASASWDDRFGQSDSTTAGSSYFAVAMHEIGHLLGLGHGSELPPGTNMAGAYSDVVLGGEASLLFGNDTESIFPGSHDIVHGQYLHRTDSRDIDMYRFEVGAGSDGEFTAEIVAERQADSSTLDSVLTLYEELPDGSRRVIAVNDDYFSDDSYLNLELTPGVYYLGVSASGNADYDPTITDSGLNGASEGSYKLRTTFRPLVASSIVDVDGSALDGDSDGIAGGVFNYWFDTAELSDTIFVDKVAPTSGANGSITNPFNRITDAFAAAQPGDVVRILPNGGSDDDLSTLGDNLAYEVGVGGLGNAPLQDGQFMDVPQGVAVVIDAGTLFKMGRSVIGVGSSTSSGDLSRGSLQILGTPEQKVTFTSYRNEDLGVDTNPLSTTAAPGDWGGIIFRNALDRAEGRFDAELDGRFLNYVAQTDFTYGGGQVDIDGQPSVITPLHMVTARPTLINNTISLSAAAAISADPNSFQESTFVTPQFQAEDAFTPDYLRVGPEIHDNVISSNSINGLFVRVETLPGQSTAAQTVAGRWNDTDIVHVVADTLTVAGTPGGPFIETRGPELATVSLNATTTADGQLTSGDTYTYRMTFVDANGAEGIAGSTTQDVTLAGSENAIRLSNLTPATSGFVARRLYRSDDGGTTFRLVAELDRSSTVHVDEVVASNTLLDTTATSVHRARLDASLVIDPGSVVKLQDGRIVSGIGAQVVAEGTSGKQVVFTSRQDDRYGAGSTFDTNNDGSNTLPEPGDWGGLYFGHMGSGSLDYALVTHGGGITSVGGSFAGFNAIEIHQSDVRIANSVIENNADGTGGQAGRVREGAGFNEEAAIFVRGAQPIIVDNVIRDNGGPAISIDAHSTNGDETIDQGRVTGMADRRETITENKGPLVRGNALGNNDINAMVLRGVTLNNQSVWDDTDIVHAVLDEIVVPDFHVSGGLRLQSSPDESLVVKFGPNAGLTSTGRPLDIDDRIGGTLQIVGSPGFPVILTSLADDSVGAGFGPSGSSANDTNNDGSASIPGPGDWRSVEIGEFSNDRNVAAAIELEPAQSTGAGINGIPGTAQNLGLLGQSEQANDDNLRLGYVISGTINNTDDVDVYSFTGTAGTEVWLDIDKTNTKLDAVLELVDAQGNILALSDNSLDESNGTLPLVNNLPADNHVNPMQDSLYNPRNFGTDLNNSFADFYSTNPLDPGFRVVLPGATGSVNPYFVRVRSSNIDSRDGGNRADLEDPSKLGDGLTEGQYELQIRLRQTDEIAGSSVTFADIRYATNGVEVIGQPGHSPLAGEAVEPANENNDVLANALDLGNLLNSDRAALGVAGELQTATDVDWYKFTINQDSTQNDGLAQHLSAVIDVDYADGLSRANTSLWLFYDDQNGLGSGSGIRLVNFGTDSNIADDQAAPLNGVDGDDLSRGSAGLLDAFIGNTALPAGEYYLAITSNQLISSYLAQFYQADAGGNTLARVEPINSTERLLENRGDENSGLNFVPYTLADIPLFISTSTGTTSDLVSVSPFTGEVVSEISRFSHVEDIAIRGDGSVFGTTSPVTGVFNDASEGGIIQIDTAGDGASTVVSANSGIQTYFGDYSVNPPAAARAFSSDGAQNGAGMEFLGLTFPQDGGDPSVFAVGSRKVGGDTFIDATGFPADSRNYVYRLDPETFQVDGIGNDRTDLAQASGAGTQARENGHIDTTTDIIQNALSQFIRMRDATPQNGEHPALLDGEQVTIQTPDGTVTYEWSAAQLSLTLIADTEPQASAFNTNQIPANIFQDTSSFELFSASGSEVFETDTGRVIVNNYQTLTDPDSFDGAQFVIQDLNGNTVTFEFDSDNTLNNAAAAPVTFDAANDTIQQVSQAIIGAIRNPPAASVLDASGAQSNLPWTANAFMLPGSDFLNSGHRISVTGDRLISNFPAGAGPTGQGSPISVSQLSTFGATAASDGTTFTVYDIGGEQVTFEFEVSGGTTPGNVPVVLQQLDASFVSQAIESAINNATFANPAFTATAELVGNGPFTTIELYGDSFVSLSTDAAGFINPLAQTVEYGVDGQLAVDGGFALINSFNPAAASIDGETLTIESELGDTVVFEFDDTVGAPGVGNTGGVPHIAVPYDPAVDTLQSLAVTLVETINSVANAAFGVKAYIPVGNGGDEIRLSGEANVTVSTAGSPLHVNALASTGATNIAVPLEEYFTSVFTFDFNPALVTPGGIDTLAASINATGLGITATVMGNRLVLDGATDVDPANMPTVAFSQGTTNPNKIPFNFADDADQLNANLLAALQNEDPNARLVFGGGNTAVQLSATASIVEALTDDSLDAPERNAVLAQPSSFTDTPNGALVTGLAYDGTEMWAVSDAGDLYEVGIFGGNFGRNSSFNSGDYINTLLDDNGNRISFSSLTTGPRNTQGGAYEDLLFGIDDNGRLYSFTKEGRPAPVFNNASWWIDTGIGGASGLAFSTLDVNLWHETTTRNTDDGHGENISFDGERRTQGQGGSSLYFGFQDPRAGQGTQPGDWSGVNNPGDTSIVSTYNPAIYDTYDLPGGAKGSIVSDYLDLSPYSSGDKPYLYFNYYLATEQANANNATDNDFMKDAFRVYASGDDGVWRLLGSNNSDFNTAFDGLDEHDYFGVNLIEVQELYDAGETFNGTAPDSWRQARVDLSQFAGNEDVRIRFDFSTAGSFDVGGIGGTELIAVAGSKLVDGDEFTVDGTTFEFDFGLVLQTTTGAAYDIGESFTVEGTTYTFATDNIGTNVLVTPTDTAETIAQRIATKLNADGLTAQIDPVNLARISVSDATTFSNDPSLDGKGFVVGTPGTTGVPVVVSVNSTETEVRDAIRLAFAQTFNVAGQESNIEVYPVQDRSIILYDKAVDDRGKLGLSDSLQGDEFGTRTGQTPRGQAAAERGQNNQFEGVYIDDVIIGFAERGETIKYQDNDTPSDLGFQENPRHELFNAIPEIETGTYQIEIRTGATYAVGAEPFPALVIVDQKNTNDRFSQSVSLVGRPGYQIIDGETFTLSDGVNTVTFEYDDQAITVGAADGVAQGNVVVPFFASDTAADVAHSIRDAINGAQAQATLDITAAMSNGSILGRTSDSSIVHLHGNASVDNTGDFNFGATPGTSITDPGVDFVLHGLDNFRLNDIGDANRFRDQGQIIIHSNIIRDSSGYGIVVDAGSRNHAITPLAGSLPHPGSALNTIERNVLGLVPGPVLVNNLIYANAVGGILFSGDSRNAATPEAVTPFGRIVNNTIVGIDGTGIGINVTENASPTLLNNVVASLATGINVDASSSTTVIGSTAYQNNGVNAVPNVGTNAILLGPSEALFVDADNRNFYPAEGSRIIDSSIDSLNDRATMTQVRDPLGIAVSPILAPNFDVTGVLRVDDPDISNPDGTGGNPFKDRGAYDRADFDGPVATLTQPIDNDPDIVDIDRTITKIRLSEGNLESFSILLVEPDGTGPDARTVTQDAIVVTENGRLLQPGVDYVFGYNTSSRLIRLTPLAGVWRTDSVYEITVNNQDAIRAEVPDQFDDGEVFEINAGGTLYTFEFDKDDSVAAGNIAIEVVDGEPKFSVTTRIVRAINEIAGLQAYHQGDSQFTVHGAESISNLITTSVGAVTDIAGNPLQANRINSLTQFTIVMPDVEMDFGDADVDGTVMTDGSGLRTLDGARHSILPVDAPQLYLGSGVDGETDGVRSANADGDDLLGDDDEDGVIFSDLFNAQTKPADVTVNVVGSGVLDVWFDWNGDGDFTDPGERIESASNLPVSTGANVVTITTPAEAQAAAEAFQATNPGSAFFVASRFRVSTNGTPEVGCIGIGGEVEDYMVEIVVGVPPTTNDDTYEVLEDSTLTVASRGVLDNDTDPDSGTNFTVFDEDPSTPGVQPLVDVARGTLVLNADGSFEYTPEPDFFGEDTFVYNAIDDRLLSEIPATVTINVQPVNDAPTAIDDEVTIFEDESVVIPGSEITLNDLRGQAGMVSAVNELTQDLMVVSATIVSPDPATVGGSVSVVNNEVHFTPGPHYNSAISGPVLVEITVEDNGQTYDLTSGMLEDDFLTDSSTLTINISALNDSPVFDMPMVSTTTEDAGLVTEDMFATNILPGPTEASDEDDGPGVSPENQTVSFTAIPHDPSLFVSGPSIDANGVLTYELAPNVNNESPYPPEILVDVIAQDSRSGLTIIGNLFDPAAVAAGTGKTYDGATISITDEAGNTVVFEFDDAGLTGVGSTNGVPHVAVPYDSADNAVSISMALASLINSPPATSIDGPGGWTAQAVADVTTGDLHLTGETAVDIQTGPEVKTLTNVFTAPGTGSYDGATFSLTDIDGDVITFELNDTTDTVSPGVAAGNAMIDYDPAFTQDQLTIAINSAIISPDPTVLATLSGSWDVTTTLPSGSDTIQMLNVSDVVIDPSVDPVVNPLATASFDSETPAELVTGNDVAANEFDATTFAAGTFNTYDGATLTVSDGQGQSIILEIDDANLPGVGVTAGVPHIAIPVDGSDTPQSFFDKVIDAINNPPAANVGGAGTWSGTAFIDAATGELRIVNGGTFNDSAGPEVFTLTNLFTGLNAGESYDGATFTVTDADGDAITFELNDVNNTATPGVAAGNSAIDFDSTFTANQLSQAISDAINAPDAAVVGALAGTWSAVAVLPAGTDQLQLLNVSAIAVDPSNGFVINPLESAQFTTESPFMSRPASQAVVKTFTILVDSVNDAPEFDFDENPIAILEDAGPQSYDNFLINARPGPADANDELDSQSLSLDISYDASAYTTVPDVTFDELSGTANLTFELAPDVNNATGHDLTIVVTLMDDGGTAGGGVDTTSQTLTIDVTPVNDAPSFTLSSSEVTVYEDNEQVTGDDPTVFVGFADPTEGPATAIDETTLTATKQNLTFVVVSVSDPTLFDVQPEISPEGDLTFSTAADQNGMAEVVVRLLDDGADSTTGNGDENQAVPDQTFTINLTPVNDAPTFDIPTSHNGSEDQGFVSVANFASNLLPGPATATDESGQQFIVTVVAAEPSAFTIAPAIAADGTLTYQTAPDVNSDNADLRLFVTLTDDGTAGPLPDTNTSLTKTVTLLTDPVNDAPTFILSENQVTVIEDTEAENGTSITTIPGVATNAMPGPASATDEAPQSLSYEIVSVSAPELFDVQPTLSLNGDLTFKTSQHKNGNAFVVVRLVDDGLSTPLPNQNTSVLQTLTITITPINDAPDFNLPATLTVDEDEGLVSQNGFATNVRRGPTGTDDENSQQVSFVVEATDPSAFAVQPAIAPDGTITFQTAADVNSSNANLEVKVKLSDSGLSTPAPNQNMSVEKTFTLIVNPVNDSPIPDGYTTSVAEDQSITITAADVLQGDLPGPADESAQSLMMTQIERTSNNGGIIEPVFSGSNIVSFTYTPPANATGTDTFLYVVSDDGTPSRSGSGTITINISGVNDPPEFTKGADITVAEDVDTVSITAWATGILAGPPNATDEHGNQTVSFDVTSNNAALFETSPAVAEDGTLTFKPAPDANGSAIVTVTAVDDGSDVAPNNNTSAAQTFTITITPVNDAPVFTGGGDVTVAEDSGAYSDAWASDIAAAAGLNSSPATATDESGQQVNFTVANDSPSLFSVQPTVSSTGQLQFTPAQDAVGQAVVTVSAVDQGPTGGFDENTSAPQTFTITISPVNDTPQAVADTYDASENEILSVAAPGLIGNDTDVDLPDDTLTAVPNTTTSSLGATVVVGEDGSFTYDPADVIAIQQMSTGQSVLDSFVYEVEDASGERSTNAVSINVQGVDDPPVAVDDTFSMGVGQTRLLDVLANDTDIDTAIDPRTIVITTLPISGSATVNQTGVVDYEAGAGFRGTDTFGYTVRDGAGNLSNEAFVTVTVNNAPTAVDDSTFTFKNQPVNIEILGNDTDPDGTIDESSVQIVAGPVGGTAVVESDGSVTFTPAEDYFGDAGFSYVVQDDVGTTSNVADVLIRVQRSRWQNPTGNMDVNADGFVSPIDALIIVNYLNRGNETFLPDSGVEPAPYLDPNGDENATPIDALIIINFLNQNSTGGGAEGEALMTEQYAMTVTPEQVLQTVGPQVLAEVQSALDEARADALDEGLLDEVGDIEVATKADSTAPFIGPVLPGFESDALDAVFDEAESSTESIELALEDLFGANSDDFIGPRRAK